ncbi:hypothetical protein FA15DRAFT_253053 [Coprinopsis marcescibilis]|uniref:Uncharacterized protein n=1 Tax=Coprinopsis marcescibilis TaxID=230819 RepID=A0A5C3KF91_COPMA|nr:hypothetical protein FA15DRAFT_253053 [Coprinopsis marcescibilis]
MSTKVICEFCKDEFFKSGIKNHSRACGRKFSMEQALLSGAAGGAIRDPRKSRGAAHNRYNPLAGLRRPGPPISRTPSSSVDTPLPELPDPAGNDTVLDQVPQQTPEPLHEDRVQDVEMVGGSGVEETDGTDDETGEHGSEGDNNAWGEEDKIRIEYHPRSRLQPEVITSDEYLDRIPTSNDLPPNPEPWRPFRTRLDFELASFMQDNNLNQPQKARLLTLIREAIEKPGSFTIEDSQDLENIWTVARASAGKGLLKTSYVVPYKNDNVEFNVWTRPIWDWAKELLQDRAIVSQFEWNAQQVYRENSDGTTTRMYTEPWTAESWWEMQSKLPEGGVPFCIILYADKTRLSSFGTKKGYPVYARCGNLPAEVRNGEGIAGGRLVGWLPVVPEDADKTGTRKFADFKRVVWHEGFERILESIVDYSKTGYFFQCGDGIKRRVFPLVMILSADYEEQCVMAAIRGTNSKCPCPICLVPGDELNQLSKTYPLRTTEEMKRVYEEAQMCQTLEAKNEILMKVGLRDIENVFWKIGYTNVYDIISWDRLHAYHLGLFGNHLLGEFIRLVEANKLESRVDAELDKFPRWRELTHFNNLAKMKEFSDGRKFEDLSKVLVYATHTLFNSDRKSPGFLLLKLVRSYLMLDMYASLLCHTEETIKGAENELRLFEQLLKAYIKHGGSDKGWIFPKLHTQVHMVMDIIRKGVTRNGNTKPNEHKHGKYKDMYQLQTNFRNTDPQIMKLEHDDIICSTIRSGLNELDRWTVLNSPSLVNNVDEWEAYDDLDILHKNPPPTRRNKPPRTIGTSQASVGSPAEGQHTLSDLLSFCIEHLGDSETPETIAQKVNALICEELGHECEIPLDSPITIYRYTKISYTSCEDLSVQSDYLRTNRSFFGTSRYDFALLQYTPQEFWFAQLACIAGIEINGTTHLIAVAIPCDKNPATADSIADRLSDKHLRLTRVRMRRGQNIATVVSIHAIVRGAVLVKDPSCPYGDEYVVMDALDPDFWLRHRKLVSQKQLRLTRLPF